eukprot:Rhum_TRINITY_DN14964_c6_g1::Rhum_TRINITY_DN14964_c6_g1_i1::g.130001::m.130001
MGTHPVVGCGGHSSLKSSLLTCLCLFVSLAEAWGPEKGSGRISAGTITHTEWSSYFTAVSTKKSIQITRLRIYDLRRQYSFFGWKDDTALSDGKYRFRYCGAVHDGLAECHGGGGCTCGQNYDLRSKCTTCHNTGCQDYPVFPECATATSLQVSIRPEGLSIWAERYLFFNFEVFWREKSKCETYTCPAGFTTKPANDGFLCAADCTNAECCDPEVKCDSYACSAGFQSKANPATLVCPGAPGVCNDAFCCDAEVRCGTYTCGAGLPDKAGKATILCTGMPPSCNDATCCDEIKCDTHACPAGFQDKAGKATIVCPGLPPVCDNALCCDAEIKCDTHPCGDGLKDKAGKAMLLCAGMPPVCSDVTCCEEVKCDSHTCGTGFQDKAGK